MKTKYIFDSGKRYSGTNSDCNFIIPAPILMAKAFEISHMEIPHTFFNINSTNNVIRWQDGMATNQTSTIPAGNYTIDTLLTEIGTQMTADTSDGLTYTATKNDTTKKITIDNGDPGNFELDWDFSDATLNLAKILGFTLTEGAEEFYGDFGVAGAFPSSSSSYTGSHNYWVGFPRNIYVRSNLGFKTKEHVSRAITVNSTNSNIDQAQYGIIRKIPLNTTYGDTIIDSPQLNTEIYQFRSIGQISNVSFELLDDNFNQIDLNGQSWSCELIFHI